MENKRMDYVPMWTRYLPMFESMQLSDSQLGALTRSMLVYQVRGKEPGQMDEKLSVFWMFIREDIVRAQLKYDQAVENGKKGGRPKKKQETLPLQLNGTAETPAFAEKPITTSTTTATSISPTETESTSPSAACGGEVSVSQKAHGEFGWVQLSEEQYRELEALMGAQELSRCITYIDRAAQSNNNRNHWKDWALVLRRCYENRWHEAACRPDPIPKGASGVLGPIELDAIQRLLRESP